MTVSHEERLKALGIALPENLVPIVGGYSATFRMGNLLIVSGQLCYGPDGKLAAVGRLGAEVTIEQGSFAARCCALNILGRAKAELGSLDRIVRIARLGGFLLTTPDFTNHSVVMASATKVMTDIFGDAGKHARATIGVHSLPLGSTVEIDALIEVA
jgi:enamine deaminase RidA (YjgF/YER057c/UK114 family)